LGATECADTKSSIIAVLTGYAYETIPNKPIRTGEMKGGYEEEARVALLGLLAPESPTLGLLAMGSCGLSI
jgi:hypothetical protein